MIKRKVLILVLYSSAGIFSSIAQESVVSDTLLQNRDKVTTPLLLDSLKFQQNKSITPLFPQLDVQGIKSPLKQQSVSNHLELNLNDSTKDSFQALHPKFKPDIFFNLGASRWAMPVIGDVTTFSPILYYQATKNLSFYGGVSFSQFHNLSQAQSILAPNWHVKSNIISNGFIGAEYRLFDRILLHGSYQRSLYNQLPSNLMMFAPGENVVVTGASFDMWNGLGVTVDHVWEFDRYGNVRKGFRYSPYIDASKFIKFLRQ